MKTLWIVGAGGFGREVLGFARDMIAVHPSTLQVGGFIDDHPESLERFETGLGVRCSIDEIEPGPEDRFCIAVGTPATRLGFAQRLQARGASFMSVVHPSAVISERVSLGEGCIVGPGAFVSVDAQVGAHVAIGFNAAVGHDAIVGDGSVITGCCIINGGARLGRGVFLGSHSVVLPRVSVSDEASSNAGSIIMRDVAAGAKVGGNPARQLPQLAV
jgi:sugar O-acyltransferase (sialic acid O-acetyltransferase NeuD family)